MYYLLIVMSNYRLLTKYMRIMHVIFMLYFIEAAVKFK